MLHVRLCGQAALSRREDLRLRRGGAGDPDLASGSSGQVTSLTYDYEDRVTSITYPGGGANTFAYSGLGARVSEPVPILHRGRTARGLTPTAATALLSRRPFFRTDRRCTHPDARSGRGVRGCRSSITPTDTDRCVPLLTAGRFPLRSIDSTHGECRRALLEG
ncbi:hypothetical protein FCG40_10835 [Fimbriimonadia bacterium ATM]|nr:hypothetical protein [Fimbriimonadia bacterium ATM]